MEDNKFQKIIRKALLNLPKEFAEKLENVSVVIADYPKHEHLETLKLKGKKGLLLGLYEGIPQVKRRGYGIGGALPDKITIFKIPILMVSKTLGELKQNVRDTVVHELGHHFGMSEEQIRNATDSKT